MRSWFRGKADTASPHYEKFVRRLSKDELDAATSAFKRACGHLQRLDIDRFRETLLNETFAGIPKYLARRLFREWNVSGAGELSLPEFTAGVAASVKGLQSDHLEMVFRMISANGDDSNISRSNVLRFLKCFDSNSSYDNSSVVADSFLRALFGSSTTGTLTLEKFRAVLGSYDSSHFINWIPNLGARLLYAHDNILPRTAAPPKLVDSRIFQVRSGISSKQREDFRCELHSILFILSTDSPNLTSEYIVDRFRDILDEDHLVNAIETAWNFANTSKETNSSQRMEAPNVREKLKLFVLGFCCAHASTVHQVYRSLFELFDEYSCGQIDVEQLSVFLQLTMDRSPIDSEREANITIRRRGRSQSSQLSPPPSPGRLPTTTSERPQVLSLQQFAEVARELPGFSHAEIETALLLFHLKQHGSQYHDDSFSSMMLHDHLPLRHLFDCYFSEQTLQSTVFCLLSPRDWQQLIEGIIKCHDEDLTANTHAQILHQEATELPSGEVMLPLPVWVLVAYWYRMKLFAPEHSLGLPADWVSSFLLYRDAQTSLHGFWVRILISFTSRDGFERVAIFPQVIAFEHCTVQSVLDGALFQKSWGGLGEEANSEVTTMCQCQVLIAERNDAGEIKTLIQQDEQMTLPQDQLASSLGSVLPLLFSSWTLENVVTQGKVSFELRFSVVEIEQQGGGINEGGLIGLDIPCDALEASASPNSSQRTFTPTGAIPRGLTNLGNTCFMNAVLQCLATTPLLRTHLIETEHRQTLMSSSLASPTRPVNQSLLCSLGDLFVGMHPTRQGATDAESSLSPAKLLEAFSALSPQMFDGNQQDAQEFLVYVLGFLGDTLKRSSNPTQDGESHILSPRSHTLLMNLFKSKDAESITEKPSARLCIGDSNGRHDRVVATEWWVSHFVSEPSVTNALFSGQFKSALTCTRCSHQSARFEPFSSLQLPLVEDNIDSKSENKRDLVVILHSAQPFRHSRGPIRTLVQVPDRSTVSDVLSQLPTSRSKVSSCEYIVGSFEGSTIQNLLVSDRTGDQIEDKTPASVLPSPTHAFEVFNIAGSGDNTTAPTTGSTKLYLRFVHRHSFLVPFYCTTPTHQALCGSPFVCSSIRGALTGQALHQTVLQRFLVGFSSRSKPQSSNIHTSEPHIEGSAHHYAPTFALRRVRDDGIACSRCHWSTGCRGCLILPTATAAELLDLENCETIAIDWDLQLHPQDASEFWWLRSYPTRDHPSYIQYRLTKTHPLMRSLQSLCSTEYLDASCSQCQHSTPHTKQLSLWSLPPLLVLQLKRFELSTSHGAYQWRKLSHSVDFPVHGLDLRGLVSPIDGGHDDSEPCTDRCFIDALDPRVRRGIEYLQNELNIPLTSASRSCTKYDLYAVVNHCGRGISSGHYTAHIRRPDETCWWLADDTVVTPLSEDELSPSTTAYLLFYVRQDVASGATELSDLFPTN